MFNITMDSEVIVTYLPLSDIAGQIIDMYIPIKYGATVYFAKPDALKVCHAESKAFTGAQVICCAPNTPMYPMSNPFSFCSFRFLLVKL